MAYEKKERSPWVYIGCGCAILGGLAIVALVVAGALGFNSAKSWMEDLEDPLLRNQKAREILGAESLPNAYNALFYMEIPWVLKMVTLTDGPIPDNPEDFKELGENSFIFINVRDFGSDRAKVRDFLTGKNPDNQVMKNIDINVNFDMKNILSRGTLDIGEQHILYAVSQGKFFAQGNGGEGIYAMLMSECPGDEHMRISYWLRKLEDESLAAIAAAAEATDSADNTAEASPEAEASTSFTAKALDPNLIGTPADPAALRRFLSNFDLCTN
jgi:hypothetical protein